MRTWLLITVQPEERLYRGHHGYQDDLTRVYRYDSFVPNHKQLFPGDVVILRGKRDVLGCAVIERIDQAPGTKVRLQCRRCGSTKLKERRHKLPTYRCECGAEFDVPKEREDPCDKYEAHFGDTYRYLDGEISIPQLWSLAPRLNKQFAMLELKSIESAEIVRSVTSQSDGGGEAAPATIALFPEAQRSSVIVNRYERDPRARRACIEHYGCTCAACGFTFEEQYGVIGSGVIEVHHLEPLSARPAEILSDPIADMRPLCANCHTIVHKRHPPLTIDELKAAIYGRIPMRRRESSSK